MSLPWSKIFTDSSLIDGSRRYLLSSGELKNILFVRYHYKFKEGWKSKSALRYRIIIAFLFHIYKKRVIYFSLNYIFEKNDELFPYHLYHSISNCLSILKFLILIKELFKDRVVLEN